VICNHHTFYVNGRNTRQEGFKALEKQFMKFLGKEEKQNEEEELEIFLGKNFGPCNASVSENYTQPPRQYTEDTLLSSMERAGNEDLTEETERKGLGTPATRAAIIEKLISSGFVKREKKNLVPTDNGNTLITVLPDEIKSPKMTAEWEMELNRIASGEQEAEVFLDGITEMLSTLVQRYHGVSDNQTAAFSGGKKESIGECPRCRSEVYEGQKSFYCSNKECSFCLWKNNRLLESQGKKMDKASAKKFLAKGKVHYKDLHSAKSGKSYEATIVMVDSGDGNVGFQMEFPKK
jgi:DNA topoisomerase-3